MARTGLTPHGMARLAAKYRTLAVERADDEALRNAERLSERLRQLGACQDCGAPLTDPVSVRAGRGPECRAKRSRRHRPG